MSGIRREKRDVHYFDFDRQSKYLQDEFKRCYCDYCHHNKGWCEPMREIGATGMSKSLVYNAQGAPTCKRFKNVAKPLKKGKPDNEQLTIEGV